MPTLNPNRKPFPRRNFLEAILDAGLATRIHPLERTALEPYLRTVDGDDFPHSLGAADVFLDNLGMLVAEQFPRMDQFGLYRLRLGEMIHAYALEIYSVLAGKPWKGAYVLGRARAANAGEPRPILRLLRSLSAGTLAGAISATHEPRAHRRYSNLNWGDLLPSGWEPADDYRAGDHQTGVELPPDAKLVVPPSRLLDPAQATPDLPLRVGVRPNDLGVYKDLVLDQGPHPTCVAHAVAAGLALAARRARRYHLLEDGFSPSWIHYAAANGRAWTQGRRLSDAMGAIRSELPCTASAFPYPAATEGAGWKTAAREADANAIKERLGTPVVRSLNPDSIAEMKTLLAAGWVVIVTTFFPKQWRERAMDAFGLPLVPLPGETREKVGHAWLLVGYDHVDGNQQWKYQGRFLALNSWGIDWPREGIWGQGLCSIPFSFFLTEGIEAFALRLEDVDTVL